MQRPERARPRVGREHMTTRSGGIEECDYVVAHRPGSILRCRENGPLNTMNSAHVPLARRVRKPSNSLVARDSRDPKC